MELLKTKAEDYARYVAGSILTRKEALYSYTFYFIPRLGFSLLAMTFTEQQCAKIQAPALQAFLPKCQINRNAAHSILFAPPPQVWGIGFTKCLCATMCRPAIPLLRMPASTG
jgi:hypothetical protein